MKNIEFEREFNIDETTGLPKSRVKKIVLELEEDNELDTIIYYLICAEIKTKGDEVLNFKNFATLNRLENAQEKLLKYIRNIHDKNKEE